MISGKFIKSSFIYSIAGTLPLASSFVLLPFYLNLLSTGDFGNFALYFAFTYLIQTLMNFGFEFYIGVNYFKYNEDAEQLKEYIGSIVISLIAIGVGVLLFAVAFCPSLFKLIFKNGEISFYPYGFMSVITAFCNSFFKTYTNLLIHQQKSEKFFFFNIYNFVITIGFSLAGLYLYPHTLVGPMWGRLLSGLGIVILAFYFFITEFGIKFNYSLIRKSLNYCYPLLIYGLLIWSLSYFDRFIVYDLMNASDVGIYDFTLKCAVLIDFFQNGMTNAINPKIYELWKSDDRRESTVEVNRYYNGFTGVTLLVLPVFVIVAHLFIPLITKNADYYLALSLIPLLGLSFVNRSLFNMFITPIFFYDKTKMIPGIFFIASVIQIIISYLLIKSFGLTGGVWACLLIKPIQIFLLYLQGRKIFKFRFNVMKQIILPSSYMVLILVSEIFMVEEKRLLFEIAQLLVIVALVFWVYRNEVNIITQQFFNKLRPGLLKKNP